MVTESKKGQAKGVDVEQEVITERDAIKEIIIDFPPEFAKMEFIIISRIKYINQIFIAGSPKRP